jgi:hypothetical protein
MFHIQQIWSLYWSDSIFFMDWILYDISECYILNYHNNIILQQPKNLKFKAIITLKPGFTWFSSVKMMCLTIDGTTSDHFSREMRYNTNPWL